MALSAPVLDTQLSDVVLTLFRLEMEVTIFCEFLTPQGRLFSHGVFMNVFGQQMVVEWLLILES
jgi:hypothetical protein